MKEIVRRMLDADIPGSSEGHNRSKSYIYLVTHQYHVVTNVFITELGRRQENFIRITIRSSSFDEGCHALILTGHYDCAGCGVDSARHPSVHILKKSILVREPNLRFE